jgi:hypothetical protein
LPPELASFLPWRSSCSSSARLGDPEAMGAAALSVAFAVEVPLQPVSSVVARLPDAYGSRPAASRKPQRRTRLRG